MLACDEVFGLQFGSAGGSEVHAEVRHALVPRARDTLLLSAGRGVVSGDWGEFFCGESCAINLGRHVGGVVGLDDALDPDLRGAVILPVGEEADAVSAAEDGVEVVLKLVEGEVFVDDLAHLEGGQQVEGDAGDDAECSERDDCAVEGVAVFGAESVERLPSGRDELDGRDDGAEVAAVDAGAAWRWSMLLRR